MSRLSGLTAIRIVLGLCVICLSVGLAQAWPTNSPSARAAARLKYHPPRNWIRHYLGDDRYKIAGKVWTVATTQEDTYYHRFTCPNMLRQSASSVIGFVSPALAADAGYQPDPVCQPQASEFIYIGPGRTGRVGGGPITTVNRGRRAQRIVLADRASTVLLPPNWRRTQSGAQTIAGRSTLTDTLQPLTGRGAILIGFIPVPTNLNIDMSKIFNAQTFRAGFGSYNRSGQVNNAAANILDNISVSNARLGGISGVAITPKAGFRSPLLRGRAIIAARGKKIYIIEDYSGNVSGSRTILNSFRPR